MLIGYSHGGTGWWWWGWFFEREVIEGADGNVFMMTSLFLLLVNQLRGRLRLLHWLKAEDTFRLVTFHSCLKYVWARTLCIYYHVHTTCGFLFFTSCLTRFNLRPHIVEISMSCFFNNKAVLGSIQII